MSENWTREDMVRLFGERGADMARMASDALAEADNQLAPLREAAAAIDPSAALLPPAGLIAWVAQRISNPPVAPAPLLPEPDPVPAPSSAPPISDGEWVDYAYDGTGIKRYREEHRIKAKHVYEPLGINSATLLKYERGEDGRADLRILLGMLNVMKAPLDTIISGGPYSADAYELGYRTGRTDAISAIRSNS